MQSLGRCHASHQRIQKTNCYPPQNACHYLQRCMADHFLQMHILKERCILFADVDPLIDHLIEHLGLLAGLMPHAHCIVHRDDGLGAPAGLHRVVVQRAVLRRT